MVIVAKPAKIIDARQGIQQKTLKKLKDFRAGIEGNISELKRAFGASKATWKGHDGFKAFFGVPSSTTIWCAWLDINLARQFLLV